MKVKEAINWIDARMCWGRGQFTEHHPPVIDEPWIAGRMAIDALERSEWIPCGERLPSNSDDVLITINGNSFVASGTYAGYHSGQWWYLGEDGEITDVPITADVIAWMPLPGPYEPKEEDE